MNKKFLITEEFNEEDVKDYGRCESTVTCYGQLTQRQINNTIGCMEKYSPFDYVDYVVFDTIEEYESCIKTRIENGSTIKYN